MIHLRSLTSPRTFGQLVPSLHTGIFRIKSACANRRSRLDKTLSLMACVVGRLSHSTVSSQTTPSRQKNSRRSSACLATNYAPFSNPETASPRRAISAA